VPPWLLPAVVTTGLGAGLAYYLRRRETRHEEEEQARRPQPVPGLPGVATNLALPVVLGPGPPQTVRLGAAVALSPPLGGAFVPSWPAVSSNEAVVAPAGLGVFRAAARGRSVLSQRWTSPFEGTRDVVIEVTVE
jgi:hypothetical protein